MIEGLLIVALIGLLICHEIEDYTRWQQYYLLESK